MIAYFFSNIIEKYESEFSYFAPTISDFCTKWEAAADDKNPPDVVLVRVIDTEENIQNLICNPQGWEFAEYG